ncbi:MAG: restriction endonuclease [Alteromonas sp.]|nr:restriction endonuclease [Flavobacteriaceae bacterium]MCB9213866.1 restriction endonuclease [Alteromonas sp.]
MKNLMEIQKASGQRVKFSLPKLRKSLQRSGADQKTIQEILDRVRDELYQGISTQEIYNRAFAMLKKRKSIFASKYKLKKAIYELGPTGFPFERFVAALLEYSGYEVAVGQYFQGKCVSHEVDVVAKKNGQYIVAECKFHGDPSRKCDVKVPLYIHSRYMDILNDPSGNSPNEGWVVTNTQFTQDAVAFGTCVGLFLLSWDFPKGNSLKDRIDRLGLYPITVSTLMSEREKGFLLERDVVLCRQLLQKHFYLDHLGISEQRKDRIMNEMKMLANRY